MSALFDFGVDASEAPEQRINGVALAVVINNIDALGEGRVQVALPWMPGVMPWARVASASAGMMRGNYSIPQIGDEVVVGFNHGDVREPIILGALWSTIARPPSLLPTDPVNKTMIRTQLGQELAFDDLLQTVTVKNTTQMSVELGPTSATISAPLASVTLGIDGSVTITALKELTLQSNIINITGGRVNISSTVETNVSGGPKCAINAAMVTIN